jgi:DNA-binding NarL/FixJ family response regulator
MNIRVTIFDDNSKLRSTLCSLLDASDGFECTGTFPDCSNLIADVLRTRPDVVLMDIRMPGINGVQAVSMLREARPQVRVLMQTVSEDNDRIFQSVLAGASGYMLKTTSTTRMLEYIREAYEGGAPMSPTVATKVLRMLAGQPKAAAHVSFSLSDRERDVLSCLVKGHSYKLIAAACGISIDTVRGHIRHIYDKLHVHSKSEAVAIAIKSRIV